MEPADIQHKIKTLMDAAGWTKYKLAKMAGLQQSTISHMFKRNNAPTFNTMVSICKAFNMTLGQFFADEGEAVVLTDEQRSYLEAWGAMDDEQRQIIASTIRQFIKE